MTLIVSVLIFIASLSSVSASALEQTLPSATRVADSSVDFPHVPRISVPDAFSYFTAGKAILVQADSKESFANRRVLGAINCQQERVCSGKEKLPNFPRSGKLIITFCY